ncbi:MAG TPA: CopD family protein [Candidatus Xenobia bacterium]|jgi:putative copper export protein
MTPEAGLQAAGLLGLVLLVGAGVYRFWVGGNGNRWGAALGGLLVACAALGSILHLAWEMNGSLDGWRDMATGTHPGRMLTVRAGVALLLLFGWRRLWLWAPLSVALLWTFSSVSHAQSWLLFSFDMLHGAAACAWMGALGYTVLSGSDVGYERLSRIGMGSVMVLALSGGYAAWIHVGTLTALWTTDYGKVLLVKLALVACGLGLAGLNRQIFLPQVATRHRAFRRCMAVEATILVGVLAVTGLLTTSDVP